MLRLIQVIGYIWSQVGPATTALHLYLPVPAACATNLFVHVCRHPGLVVLPAVDDSIFWYHLMLVEENKFSVGTNNRFAVSYHTVETMLSRVTPMISSLRGN